MIYTVGIGPGDPDIMPFKTVKLLNTADVIAGFETVLNIVRPHFNPFAKVISMGVQGSTTTNGGGWGTISRRQSVCGLLYGRREFFWL